MLRDVLALHALKRPCAHMQREVGYLAVFCQPINHLVAKVQASRRSRHRALVFGKHALVPALVILGVASFDVGR